MPSPFGEISSAYALGSGWTSNLIPGFAFKDETVSNTTKANNEYNFSWDASREAQNDAITKANASSIDTTGMWKYYDPYFNSASTQSPGTSQQLQYIDAPYAEMYGMDASTAYNEALSNTAYQRKVSDLKKAGLNPVLGISGSGASNFYGSPMSMSGSGSGGSYGSSGSGKSTLSLSEGAQKLSYWLPTVTNGIVNMAVSLSPAGKANPMAGYGAGMVAQNLVSGVLGAIRNHA